MNQKERRWNEKKLRSRSFIPTLRGVVHNTVKVSYVWILNVLWWLILVFEKHLVQRYPIYFPCKNGPPLLSPSFQGSLPTQDPETKMFPASFKACFFFQLKKTLRKKTLQCWKFKCHSSPCFFLLLSSWDVFFSLRPKADLRFSWQLGLHLEGTPSRCGSPSHGSDVFVVVVAWFLGFLPYEVEAIEPTLYCTRWFVAIVGWKRLQRFFLGGVKFCHWGDGGQAEELLIHQKSIDSLRTQDHLRDLSFFWRGQWNQNAGNNSDFSWTKVIPQTKCWKFQVSFFCLGMVESNDQRYQHPWSKVNFGISSWILPHVAGDGGGGCTKECQKTPLECAKKKSEFRHSGNWFGLDVGRKRP